MKISEGQKARMRGLDNKLLASIKSHTNLEIREIRMCPISIKSKFFIN